MIGRRRRPPARRLQADHPAPRGRQPDRAADVAGVRHRHQPGRDGGGRTAAGSRGGARGVPRVAARAEGDRLGGRLAAELGQRRLADGDDAGGAEAGAENGVGGCRQSSDRSSPLPMYSGRPARQAPTSLSRNGTPWNGPRGSAGSAAMARPTSGSGTTTAFSTGLAASMRAIALSASSAGVTSPSATRSRRATASSHPDRRARESLRQPARRDGGAQVALRPPVDVVVGDLGRQPLDPAAAVARSSSSASSIVPASPSRSNGLQGSASRELLGGAGELAQHEHAVRRRRPPAR